MSSHDALTERGGGRSWRARWHRAWSSLGAALSRRGPSRAARVFRPTGRQLSRKLSPIERTLTRESPELAGLFGVFAQLAADEPTGGVEQLPAKPFPRPRPAAVAVLLALASVVALCLTLSARMTPATNSCSVATAPLVANSVAVVHGIPCGTYPANK